MRKIRLVIVVLALLSTTQVFAQLGLTFGYQLTHFTPAETETLHGFRGGLIYNLPLLGPLSIEPGVLYSLGTNTKYDNTDPTNPQIINTDTKINEHFIHIPVHAKLRIQLQPETAWVIYGGPTFAFGVKPVSGHKKNDKLIGVGTGIEFGPVLMHAGYDYGLGNRLENEALGSVRRSCFHVGVSFYLNNAAASR